MKIGKLAALCGVSTTTIRYYVSIGMLAPDASDSQYQFSERDLEDLKLILRMKGQHFKLSEIQEYLVLTRHSNMIEPTTIQAAIRLLQDKKKELRDEISSLNASCAEIDQEIERLNSLSSENHRITGVPLSAVHLLCCPHCGGTLAVNDAKIQNGYLVSGTLSCPSCAEHGFPAPGVIRRGIIETSSRYTGENDRPDLERGLYRNMTPEFSLGLQRCYDRLAGQLKEMNLDGKVLLEANINGYFYLYHHLQLLPADCTLIVVDKYPEMLEMYKGLIERLNSRCQILYIASAETCYPLKKGCVDLHISFFGENEYMLYHPNAYLTDALPFFKEDTQILGAFLSFPRDSRSRKNLRKKYPESSPRCYQLNALKEEYAICGFTLNAQETGVITDSQTRRYSFDCHVKGDPLSIYSFLACKD